MSEPIVKRADQLIVGDRIQAQYLPHTYYRSVGEVLFLYEHDLGMQRGRWIFAAYKLDDGSCESTNFMPEADLLVHPADDAETTQPIAGRAPEQYGAVTGESLVPQPIARHYDASDDYGADVADCACGRSFDGPAAVERLNSHIARANAERMPSAD